MSKKITYLLGAGASCEALPVVENFGKRIRALGYNVADKFPLPSNSNATNMRNEMSRQFVELAKSSSHHQSVDTYAKLLYLTKKTIELELLKINLSMFFILEQSMKKLDANTGEMFPSL